jgi:site-specific DNA-cytosine methylase
MEGGEVLVKDIICVSLFNGMGCSFQAIDRVPGLRCVQKISSEIDKYANIVNDANYPETIQLGSVTDIEVLKENGVAVGLKGGNGVEVMFEKGVDILFVGGSPCQSFSFSGKRNGMSTKDNVEVLTLEHYLELKSEKYEFDGQSYLFWEFIRLREEIKPKYYLLENVEMGEKWEKVLSKAVGVNGIHINSALVSAQSRKRIYWINFGMRPMGLFGDMQSIVEQPKDRGILLKDILEEEVDEKYFLSEKAVSKIERHNNNTLKNEKSNCLLAGYYKQGGRDQQYIVHNTLPRLSKTGKGGTGPLKTVDGKTYCLDTERTNVVEFPAIFDDYNGRFRKDGKSCTLTLNSGSKSERNGQKVVLGDLKESLLSGLKSKDKRLKKMIENSDLVDGEVVHLDTYNQTLDREKTPTLRTGGKNDSFVYAPTLSKEEYKFRQDTPIPEDKDKFGSLRANAGGKTRGVGLELLSSRIRRLTPLECMRLQTVDENFKWEMVGQFKYIDYICEESNFIKLWNQSNVKLTNAKTQLQLNKLNSVQNTTNMPKDMACWKLKDQSLIKQLNAKSESVPENNKQIWVTASCTIKDSLDTEQQIWLSKILKEIKSVCIVMKKLPTMVQKDYVQNTIKCHDYTGMHYMLKIEEVSQVKMGTFAIEMELAFTEQSWKTISGENLTEKKLSIISTLLKPITTSLIYTYAKTHPNMRCCIRKLNLSKEKEFTCHVYHLSMENTFISDSSIYKMLGNGWNIETIVHLFNYITLEK